MHPQSKPPAGPMPPDQAPARSRDLANWPTRCSTHARAASRTRSSSPPPSRPQQPTNSPHRANWRPGPDGPPPTTAHRPGPGEFPPCAGGVTGAPARRGLSRHRGPSSRAPAASSPRPRYRPRNATHTHDGPPCPSPGSRVQVASTQTHRPYLGGQSPCSS
ncbi:hypothetical protein N7457_000854 [Penicillium paradoxum]|uniref:uncharacterized protein n=1 Tax=Penicillium paradoxum TaxID=176176 RepID=UPI0025471C5C|nr:uncharacterized protein N7457_000829 [Penicillium paradoxum]XP_057035796.1 uncharacterized protein N7457_000834 [Penicillium paradoxum]XP_057035798.1 uncharacterized protein N7457_000839 [Penicillium paradoxum]XP_057035799.1 uncharacterized protein N7457_000844 [Penicillium paradoxum]XP_057035803.1 uncharacterized protein N7457_000854 [Penicillium paradoxum]KAJ5794230.1 hypothetical protein N7457_000829 [Penicillium paradoxum]KAJ5794235.1 hypothetical protein N7457_000834 [Penicillium para